MNIDEHEHMRCPITKMIFNIPVVCEDGHTYEEDAINEWFINNNTSPITNLPINKKYYKNFTLSNFIDQYLNTYPENKKKVYIPHKINFNMDEVSICRYLQFVNIEFSQIPLHIFTNNKIIKYIIDKCVDLEAPTADNWRPIHFICKNSTPEMIKYIIDKGVDLEAANVDNWKPIHIICRYSTPEMIKYIIDKGVNLEAITDNHLKPIHLICQYSTPEMIKYIIDKEVDRESTTVDNLKPIHLIQKYSIPKMIKYIIDKGVDLEAENADNQKPIHLI